MHFCCSLSPIDFSIVVDCSTEHNSSIWKCDQSCHRVSLYYRIIQCSVPWKLVNQSIIVEFAIHWKEMNFNFHFNLTQSVHNIKLCCDKSTNKTMIAIQMMHLHNKSHDVHYRSSMYMKFCSWIRMNNIELNWAAIELIQLPSKSTAEYSTQYVYSTTTRKWQSTTWRNRITSCNVLCSKWIWIACTISGRYIIVELLDQFTNTITTSTTITTCNSSYQCHDANIVFITSITWTALCIRKNSFMQKNCYKIHNFDSKPLKPNKPKFVFFSVQCSLIIQFIWHNWSHWWMVNTQYKHLIYWLIT